MKSENKNFLLNVIYQLLTYIFPLITVSYISRVLGVNNVGIYSYTYSIVYMFMLVGLLGISNYGNRAVAMCRDDKEQLSKTFCTIYGLQLLVSVTVLIAYVVYLTFICNEYKVIAELQIVYLISVCFDINWFYFGLEKFKMTITRNLIIKISSILLIFLLVKSSNDLWMYTLIMAGSTLASQIYLVINLPRFISFTKVGLKEMLSRFKGVLILFIPVLAFGVYRVMDKTMIGALSSVTELGYFENAERLINIPVAVINSLGTVMLPRMSYILKDDTADYKKPIFESMKLVMIMATVMACGLILIADDVSVVLFGSEFEKSGGIIKALAITVLASAWANVIRTQFLIPKNMDNIYVFSTVGGAVLNLICNTLLIGRFGAYGACIGTIIAEYFVMLYQTVKVRKYLEIRRYLKQSVVCLIKAAIVVGIAYVAGCMIPNIYIRLSVEIIVSVIAFGILNYKFLIYDFLGVK